MATPTLFESGGPLDGSSNALLATLTTVQPQQGRHGTSSGLHIEPGTTDNGWTVPPPVELEDGTLVQLYKDGEALQAAYQAIASARRCISLEVYIFHSDEAGWAFAELVACRAREGLDVRVVYDSVGSVDSDRGMFECMRRAGVLIREFHPVDPWQVRHGWRPFNRDHRKLLLIDDETAVLGGQNLGNEYGSAWVIGEKKRQSDEWRDTAIGVRGPSVRRLVEAFDRMWKYLEHGGPIHHAELVTIAAQSPHGTEASTLEIPDDSMEVLASVPSPRSRLLPSLRRLLRDARSSIEMTMAYFAPPDELFHQLCRSARGGVRVRLMLPGQSDVLLLFIAARAFYDDLIEAGVEVYERENVVLHAKTLCVDRRISIVGSTNLDYRSIQYNCELSAVIHSRTFGAQMHELFEHDVCYARAILADEWRHRPLRDRLVQWAVMRCRYLL